MSTELRRRLRSALERPHRLGMLGGDLDDHVAHGWAYVEVVSALGVITGRGADLGTGGGVPGIAVALGCPAIDWSLIEIRTSRATEVERMAMRLDLDNVEVSSEPAQVLGHTEADRERFDVVVARAFGPPAIAAECAAGLLRIGGVLVVSEPPSAEEDRWPDEGLHAMGLSTMRSMDANGVGFAVMEKVTAVVADLPRLPPRHDRGWPHQG